MSLEIMSLEVMSLEVTSLGAMLIQDRRGLKLVMSNQLNYSDPRSFACSIVQRLVDAGYQALFAGGCVRDQWLGLSPKDYDIATQALPEQVQHVFGERKTLAIGASFGVITVVGSAETGNIEIATFRSDGTYTDGRRPDSVTFTDARQDALRRDFTINGLFFDPLSNQLLDFVGGADDLRLGVIRAIGDPADRFGEDNLRMLRAIRFASVFGFQIEAETLAAIRQYASGILKVSGERIGAELQRTLCGEYASSGLRWLRGSGLEPYLLQELTEVPDDRFGLLLDTLDLCNGEARLGLPLTLESVIGSALIFKWVQQYDLNRFLDLDSNAAVKDLMGWGDSIVARWKLSNRSQAKAWDIFRHVAIYLQANRLPWSRVQPTLLIQHAKCVWQVADCVARLFSWERQGLELCYDRLQWPLSQLDPAPLIDGGRLKAFGIAAGPLMGQLLRELRQRQLDGQLQNQSQAEDFVQGWIGDGVN